MYKDFDNLDTLKKKISILEQELIDKEAEIDDLQRYIDNLLEQINLLTLGDDEC